MSIPDIETRLKNLPNDPGVYIMRSATDEIIYVGKAKNLKKRVSQYFGSYGKNNRKVAAMVSHIADFEYIIVKNELESLILESNLIKDNLPKYNILLRDDKQYPYIKITRETFPRVIKTRKILKDGAKYYGPYPDVTAVNNAIDIFMRLFPLRTCSLVLPRDVGKYRPCLNYFIGHCVGPCTGEVNHRDYMTMVSAIENLLDGKDDSLFDDLAIKMQESAARLDFEMAARYRDDMASLKILKEKQIISSNDLSENQDVIALARGIDDVLVEVFFIREGKIIGREHYFMKDYFTNHNEKILNAFLRQFYGAATFIPKELIVESTPEDKTILEAYLAAQRGGPVTITVPQRGDKLALVKMVKKNAIENINKYADKYAKKQNKNKDALKDLQDTLRLSIFPSRIEAFDISNTYGINSVGSMVVFEEGVAKKSDYRKFKIKTVQGADDYGSMEEVLHRRFSRGLMEKHTAEQTAFSKFPDLILMDGGKGQVNVALKVLKDLGLNIEVAGLVKDDFHTTRGIIYNNEEFTFKMTSNAYQMIYKIQEEAHRFAINYHRKLRESASFKSELDLIAGIGIKRRQALMSHFKSMSKIKTADVNSLANVPGMNHKAAESVYNYFHRKDNPHG
ncbi:excinuclease ABC subunit UvrC [Peptoniphilus equinus]|uniref:UvrABC system protein C n=1 Tax=Peptoniphilus equinus TaxID=3016343 RepID=A0ABY7QX99_9FIRM|nr:excinuclease ABC subunit UvrC [Peptoniphilus equinus]WBW50725.1 excinuclease ABC subunit UvrC [Peptoniphilus equinus]